MISREAFRGEALLYAGHGSGAKYFSHESMLGQRGAPLGLLMGCSSGTHGVAWGGGAGGDAAVLPGAAGAGGGRGDEGG